jgi:outer membrane protein OmpA-like peptidoglycan-associated protein
MKSKYLLLMAMACMMVPATAQVAQGVSASNISVERNGKLMTVDMKLNMENLKVKSNQAVLIIPCLVGAQDSTELEAVAVYGRRRYYYYKRNRQALVSEKSNYSYRAKSCPDVVDYKTIISYEDWQSGADLVLKQQTYGCCGSILADNAQNLGSYYTEPVVETPKPVVQVVEKNHVERGYTLGGSALVHFRVNKTDIDMSYLNNTAEIGKITQLIDSIKAVGDVVIKKVTLKGYASPEGSYSANEILADGRTKALKQYIDNLYKFDPSVVVTEYEPEDWEGLRKYVLNSEISNKLGILEIINSTDLQPDAREAKLRAQYPKEYTYLLQNCYPLLRHTDYAIECEYKRLEVAE